MKKAELLFIPFPGFSHVAMALEMTKFLIKQDHRLSVTLILTKSPFDSKVGDLIDSTSSISKQHPRINFIILPEDNTLRSETNPNIIMGTLMEYHIPSFRDAVAKHIHETDSPQVAGLVVDTLCSPMMDVADEFGIPKYSFFPSCAASLGLMLHLQTIPACDYLDITTNPDPDAELLMQCFVNPMPVKVFPDAVLDKAGAGLILHHIGRIRETRGLIMNTFMELETHTIQSLISSCQLPPLYPVGPILNMLLSSGRIQSSNNNDDDDDHINNKKPHDDIIKWLDDQPPLSVVFLCFGSVGYFSDEQLKEIGNALINCGIRFVWSLREPHKEVADQIDIESEFSYAKRVLTKEFFHRTAGIGKVTGWAPQIAILSHPATGGFVSHCGWNSMLESVSFGVPVAAWPLYADHNPIAFQMVKELGLGVAIRLDYKLVFPGHVVEENEETILVNSREIEMAIRKVMEVDSDIRNRVKEMSQKCNAVFIEAGSSYSSMLRLVNDVINNMPDNQPSLKQYYYSKES